MRTRVRNRTIAVAIVADATSKTDLSKGVGAELTCVTTV